MMPLERLEFQSSWKVAKCDCSYTGSNEGTPGGEFSWIPAEVPGAVQYDLVRAGQLENPYASTKSAFAAAWVAKSDWVYRNEFMVPPEMRIQGHGQILLRVNGIDTFSGIWVNGRLIGETSNAYRVYEFPISAELLHAGGNLLDIHVKAHARMIASKLETASRLELNEGVEGRLGKALIRRYQRSFYSGSSLLNLGTGVLGIGINKPIEIRFYPGSRITDCFFRTLAITDKGAQGEVTISVDPSSYAKVRADVEISGTEDACPVAVFSSAVENGTLTLPVLIENPRLWWPAGYGSASLYRMTVRLYDTDQCVQVLEQLIGIKTVELVEVLPNGRKTFHFKVNGKKIYVRGQNFVPLDYIKVHGKQAEYKRIFRLMANAHTNLVRIWGGGAIEEPYFYDQCDRLGIMVWQECFLHSNTYPDYDADFVREFLEESEGVIRQVRPHASLSMICGGNEQQEGWDEWGWKDEIDRFYGERLPREFLVPVAHRLCPEIPYIYNSPHGGKWSQSPVEGECHNWGNFYNSTKDPLFVTETCWTTESYSRPETLKKYMGLDVDDYDHFRWFKDWQEKTSLSRMNRLPYSNWFDVKSLRSYLHSLEIEQARADYNALGMFRFRSPSCSGIVYWPLNKGGPLFQYGCVDYGGYPLMSYYVVKRLYAGVAASIYRDVGDLQVMVSNESGAPLDARLEVLHLDASGVILKSWETQLRQESGTLDRPFTLKDYYSDIADRTKEAVYVRVTAEDRVLAEDILYFCPFSEFAVADRPIQAQIKPLSDASWEITLEADAVAQMVELESNKKLMFSDNYFPMVPHHSKIVTAWLLEDTGEEAAQLRVGSLGTSGVRCVELTTRSDRCPK
ncbi:MAG TPA: glycoside hydrolase family 2 protein [Clostridia bacterium]